MVSVNQKRSPADEVVFWYDKQYSAPEKKPYASIQFELSNQLIEVIRVYPTVVNLFQKIGGVAQIFMFVFTYLMIYNNDLVVELYLLNFGVLMMPQEVKEGPKKLNQVADVSIKRQESNTIKGYTYWEILRFRLFSCCQRKKARYQQYRKHKEIIEERMDIVNFITAEGNASLLSRLAMKPYQLALASQIQTSEHGLPSSLESVSMEKAIQILERKEQELETTEIED